MNAPATSVVLVKTELERALAAGTPERRAEIAARIADVFSVSAADSSLPSLLLFDDLFLTLIGQVSRDARARLARRLSGLPATPPSTVRRLALDDLGDVATPILRFCVNLGDDILLEAARTKSPEHLLAISRRHRVEMPVTDVLIERGDRAIVLTLAGNPGARISHAGFGMLVERSHDDDVLAESVGVRVEIPRHLFVKLLAITSDVVRHRLQSHDPIGADAIRSAAAEAKGLMRTDPAQSPYDYASARSAIAALRSQNGLDEAALASLARQGKVEECVVALACLSDTSVERVESTMLADRAEPLLILVRAVNMSWETAKALLALRRAGRSLSQSELLQRLATFSRLKPDTARQVLAFQRRRALR